MQTIDAFVAAAQTGDIDKIQRNLALFDINGFNKTGDTALHRACTLEGNDVVVGALLDGKANVNIVSKDGNSWTPLLYATFYASGMGIVRQLIEARADPCALHNDRDTVLHSIAILERWEGTARVEMAAYLLANGAQPCLTMKSANYGSVERTPAAFAEHKKLVELAKFLNAQEREYKNALLETIMSCVKVKTLALIILEYFN